MIKNLRRILKRVVFFLSIALVFPMIFGSWLEKKLTNSEIFFIIFGQFLAIIPGLLGSYLRSAYYYGALENTSWEAHIGFGSFFTHRLASLKSNVSIGTYCVMGSVTINKEVMIASRVSITSGKRQHLDESGKICSAVNLQRINIGRKTWVGEGAIISANIGENCVISAGTVVTKDVESGKLAAGNPFRIICSIEELRPLQH